MLSFGLLIACNLLDERIPSLSGSVTHGNLRAPEGEAGEEEGRKEGGQKKSGEVGGLRGQDVKVRRKICREDENQKVKQDKHQNLVVSKHIVLVLYSFRL